MTTQDTSGTLDAAANAIKQLEVQLVKSNTEIDQLKAQIKTTNEALSIAEDDYIRLKGEEKKEAKVTRDLVKNQIKILKDQLASKEEFNENIERQLSTAKRGVNKVATTKGNNDNVLDTFQKNNIHYVISSKSWWTIDPDGERTSPKITKLDSEQVMDTVMLESDWKVNNAQELKQIAKENGRIYKHIVRDFSNLSRPHTYNQMTDIRKYWLTPQPPQNDEDIVHIAFRLLVLSIAGGDKDYADQIERIIAYRYCHPQDVMIPNLDSCAIGGTGRDTLFNLLRYIFTDECCVTVSEETFSGTHNGELFGKMWVKVSEKDSRGIPIDKVKELTGDTKYRHRSMGEDARDAIRLFIFMFFRNGFTTTAKLAGTGSSGEDRRFEPVIARHNLAKHTALFHGWIKSLDDVLADDDPNLLKAMKLIKDWQQSVFRDEYKISRWLYHIIDKHQAVTMTELLPLHGSYYQEMVTRQKYGVENFMPKFVALMKTTNVISIHHIHQLYQVAETTKVSKDWLKNQVIHWLNTRYGWDCEVSTDNIWPDAVTTDKDERRKFAVITNKQDKSGTRRQFDLNEFIDPNAPDDKGNPVGNKITFNSILTELQ
jgi:hypothetical protein